MSQVVAYVANYYPLLGHLMGQRGVTRGGEWSRGDTAPIYRG